ncbi:MAG: cupin domain-containing protein [SAR202 cluster bacterium]|nr:cupin domain-containing protein [SAR202 cluster bacterium]
MTIINHRDVPETPWRPRYRMWHIAGPQQGLSSRLSYSEVAPGAGAPLHFHESDEIIVVLSGELEVRIGEHTHRVGADHTIAVPPGTPHGFTVSGESDARLYTFFPVSDPFGKTTFLEGTPPPTASR